MCDGTPSRKSATPAVLTGTLRPSNGPQWRRVIFVLFLITLCVQGYTMLGTRVIAQIDQAVKERKETYELMGRLELQDSSLLFSTVDKQLAIKNLPYFQLRARLEAINARQNEAFTGLYQWNAVWAAPITGIYTLATGKDAGDLWGADRPNTPGDAGRIHYGSEVMARTLLEVLQGLVLPIFYAALGAWVRLIRDRRHKANAGVETVAAVDVREPLMLGAIVGSVLGFFYTADLLGSQVTSLPLMGLSFFAGYSIDWLFRLLDRIAAGKDAAAPPVEERSTPSPGSGAITPLSVSGR